jgi:hypothetical protein
MRRITMVGLFFIVLIACKKTNTTDPNSGSSGSGGSVGNTGSLIMNITWNTPAPTVGCPTTAFVDVSINGPTSNFNQTISSPGKIDKRLATGNYTYTIKKRPNTNCFNYTQIIKTGSFVINACPTICGNATVLTITLD